MPLTYASYYYALNGTGHDTADLTFGSVALFVASHGADEEHSFAIGVEQRGS
ncbi:hypothetical protein [Neokomagataea thailandica]|uniref:hypothetical protein n=1 Tax=Neokomagataea TaxID=1223423 RepID=UPI0012ECFF3B|nr:MULTISPECIES: hypothetical protein [Neokomagataea]